jgi:hypothetical protein
LAEGQKSTLPSEIIAKWNLRKVSHKKCGFKRDTLRAISALRPATVTGKSCASAAKLRNNDAVRQAGNKRVHA